MAKIININSAKKNVTIAAATAAMCINLNLSASDSAAAQAALHDIAQEEGASQARAIIVSMGDPFHGFIA